MFHMHPDATLLTPVVGGILAPAEDLDQHEAVAAIPAFVIPDGAEGCK